MKFLHQKGYSTAPVSLTAQRSVLGISNHTSEGNSFNPLSDLATQLERLQPNYYSHMSIITCHDLPSNIIMSLFTFFERNI